MTKLKLISGVLATILMSTTLLSGCNTIKGIGQDLKKSGTAIESVAKDKGAKDTQLIGANKKLRCGGHTLGDHRLFKSSFNSFV